jgi:hypothetical protein
MSYAPHAAILVIGSPSWGRVERPKPYRHHRLDRERWPRQDIPHRDQGAVRRIVEEMRELGRKTVESAKPQIEALLALSRAA